MLSKDTLKLLLSKFGSIPESSISNDAEYIPINFYELESKALRCGYLIPFSLISQEAVSEWVRELDPETEAINTDTDYFQDIWKQIIRRSDFREYLERIAQYAADYDTDSEDAVRGESELEWDINWNAYEILGTMTQEEICENILGLLSASETNTADLSFGEVSLLISVLAEYDSLPEYSDGLSLASMAILARDYGIWPQELLSGGPDYLLLIVLVIVLGDTNFCVLKSKKFLSYLRMCAEKIDLGSFITDSVQDALATCFRRQKAIFLALRRSNEKNRILINKISRKSRNIPQISINHSQTETDYTNFSYLHLFRAAVYFRIRYYQSRLGFPRKFVNRHGGIWYDRKSLWDWSDSYWQEYEKILSVIHERYQGPGFIISNNLVLAIPLSDRFPFLPPGSYYESKNSPIKVILNSTDPNDVFLLIKNFIPGIGNMYSYINNLIIESDASPCAIIAKSVSGTIHLVLEINEEIIFEKYFTTSSEKNTQMIIGFLDRDPEYPERHKFIFGDIIDNPREDINDIWDLIRHRYLAESMLFLSEFFSDADSESFSDELLGYDPSEICESVWGLFIEDTDD